MFTFVDEGDVLALKLLMFCFEGMSGMKINYQKSEVYVLRIEDMLNCKVGSLPFTYLGLPMRVDKLGEKDFLLVSQKVKVEKRL